MGCGATDLALLQEVVRNGGYDLGVAFDGDGDRMLAVDEAGQLRSTATRSSPCSRSPSASTRSP